ncbi:MAG: subclass B3 metallo-beta-lactamase, partial [Bradyrhizobium sp.]|nr:subclass B3 metallo-beta-lactamase [Bradyrhizobium sp.]
VKDGEATRSVIFFCSATVALNQLVGRPTYPGIVDDYKKTYAWAKTVHPDILLAPHPEMFDLAAKRAKIAEGGPTPFVRPGEFNAYLDRLETQFNEGLSKQTAALQTGK